MFGIIKKIFTPAPRKIGELEARLIPVDPSVRLRGDAEFDLYEDDSWRLELEVDHPSNTTGTDFEVRFDGVTVAMIPANRGRETEVNLSSRRGDELAKYPQPGTVVDVFAGGTYVLRGEFIEDFD